MAEQSGAKIRFEDLGEVIQNLLKTLKREASSEELTLLSTITVREMAKVYDMLGRGDTPEMVMAWLLQKAKMKVEVKEKPRRDVVEQSLNDRNDVEGDEAAARAKLQKMYREQIATVVDERERVFSDEDTHRLEIKRWERKEYAEWYAEYSMFVDQIHAAEDGLQFVHADEARKRVEVAYEARREWGQIFALWTETITSLEFLRKFVRENNGAFATWAEWLLLATKLDAKLLDEDLVDELVTTRQQTTAEEEIINREESMVGTLSGSEVIGVTVPDFAAAYRQMGCTNSEAQTSAAVTEALSTERKLVLMERIKRRLEHMKKMHDSKNSNSKKVTFTSLDDTKQTELDEAELAEEKAPDWKIALDSQCTIADFREYFDHYKLPMSAGRVAKFRAMPVDVRVKAFARLEAHFGPRPKVSTALTLNNTSEAGQLQLLRTFFAQHSLDYDPKLLMVSYANGDQGGYEEMWRRLREQYREEEVKSAALTTEGSGAQIPSKNEQIAKLAMQIATFYKKYCPSKADQAENLANAFYGHHMQMWKRLWTKYGGSKEEVASLTGQPFSLTGSDDDAITGSASGVLVRQDTAQIDSAGISMIHVEALLYLRHDYSSTVGYAKEFNLARLKKFYADYGVRKSEADMMRVVDKYFKNYNTMWNLLTSKYGDERPPNMKFLKQFDLSLDSEEGIILVDDREHKYQEVQEEIKKTGADAATAAQVVEQRMSKQKTEESVKSEPEGPTHEFTADAREVIESCEKALNNPNCPQRQKSLAWALLSRYAGVMMKLTNEKQKLDLQIMQRQHTAAACLAHALDHTGNLYVDQDNADQWLMLAEVFQKSGHSEEDRQHITFADWGQYVGKASTDVKTNHIFSVRQCLLNSIKCATKGHMPWNAMYQLSRTMKGDKNEYVTMQIAGKPFEVTCWHILEYILSNAPPTWSEWADIWKDMGDRIPAIYGYANLQSRHQHVSIYDCYLKAASLDNKYCVDLASVMDEDETVMLNGVKRNYLQLLLLAATADTTDNWEIWSRLWVYLSSTGSDFQVTLPPPQEGVVVTPDYCLRRGTKELFASHWFSTDSNKAGQNYTKRVEMNQKVRQVINNGLMLEQHKVWTEDLQPIGEKLHAMARQQYRDRCMMYEFWEKGRHQIVHAMEPLAWEDDCIATYRKVTGVHNAKVREAFKPKFEAVIDESINHIKDVLHPLFEREMKLYQSEFKDRLDVNTHCYHEAVADLQPTLRRLNKMHKDQIAARAALFEEAELGVCEVQELEYMGWLEIIEYYRDVARVYNAMIVAKFRPLLDAVEAEEERARQREEGGNKMPWENIERAAKVSKKEVMVFEVEQGHQRRYDNDQKAFRVIYKTMTIKPAVGTVLPPALVYLLEKDELKRWSATYSLEKRRIMYLHNPSGLSYEDPLATLGLKPELDFAPCTGAAKQHPADYLLEQGVWMEVPEDEECTTMVYFNAENNDSTYDIKGEWARPATAKPVMKEMALKKIEEEKKKKAATTTKHADPIATAGGASPKKKALGPKVVYLKVWSDEYSCYYFQNLRTDETSWDEPAQDAGVAVYSAVTQEGVEEPFYLNDRTESRRWDLPKEGELRTLESSTFGSEVGSPVSLGDTLSKEESMTLSGGRTQSMRRFKTGEGPASPKAFGPPDVFVELTTEEGDAYFMNFKTNETMWERPTAWSAHTDAAADAPEDQAGLMRQHSVRVFKKVMPEGGLVDGGDAYYWNEKTGKTAWDLEKEFKK